MKLKIMWFYKVRWNGALFSIRYSFQIKDDNFDSGPSFLFGYICMVATEKIC